MADLLLNDEEILLKNTVSDYSKNELAVRAAGYDESALFPWDNVSGIADLGLFGLTIAEEYGGSGGTTRQLAIAAEEIAKGCAATSVIYIAHLSLCTQFINMFGSEEQKKKYLPKLTSGEWFGSYCLTEPTAGSDANSGKTKAELSEDGTHYLISGHKIWISNAGFANLFIVFARIEDDKNLTGFIVPNDPNNGIKLSEEEKKLGIHSSSTRQVFFEKTKVPVENLLGERNGGFKIAMNTLGGGRIGIAAQGLGIARAALEAAVSYAGARKQFGKTIGSFGAIQNKLANTATEIDAARLLIWRAAKLKDRGKPYVKESSMAKLYASTVAMKAATDCVQIYGGCLLYTSPSPRDGLLSRMPSSA